MPAPSLSGWSLISAEVWQETRPSLSTHEASFSAGDATAVLTWAPRDAHGLEGARELFLEVRGARVFAAGWFADSEEIPLVGVSVVDDDLLVWSWQPDAVILVVSRHHPRTGRRLGPAVAVRGQPPHLIDRPQRLFATRPLPVVGRGAGLTFVLYQGDDVALLFEEPDAPGVLVGLDLAPTFDVASPGAPKLLRWIDGTLAP